MTAMGWLRLSLAGAWLLLAPAALALSEVDVTFDGVRMEFRLDAIVRAPAQDVRAVIHDYDHLDRVFPLVADSRSVGSPEAGVERVRTLMRGCVLFVCRQIVHTLDIRRTQTGWSSGITVPERSRIRRGHFAWQVEELPENLAHSSLRMYGYFEPDFVVPRVLGAPLLRSWARAELRGSIGRIERVARAHQSGRAAAAAAP
jgi:hypothetical protein